ncbi:MAG TPA: VWA domain-containing protein [Thermoanaerobaculia bacterium]|jgi:VWFA-related protein
MLARVTIALLFVASLAQAQTAETVEVTVTNVDVVVSDSKGNPVRGLTKDDFEVLQNGNRREITNFAELSKGTASEPAPRRLLVFLDNSSLTMPRRRATVDALKAWMADVVRPTDSIMIVSSNPSLNVRQEWTRDPAKVAAAFDALEKETPGRHEQERRRADQSMKNVLARAQDEGGNVAPVSFDELMQVARFYAQSAMQDSTILMRSLGGVVNYFSRLPEKKVLLIVGEGLEVNPGYELFAYLHVLKGQIDSGLAYPRLQPSSVRAAPLMDATQYDIGKSLRSISQAAVQKGIVVYALNPGQNDSNSGTVELTAPADVTADFARTTGAMTGYQILTGDTGGRGYFGAKPNVAFSLIQRDLDSYYSIGFTGVSGGRTPEAIVVKTKAGHRVRETIAAAPLSTDELVKDTVIANHLNAPAANDLKIVLAADPPVAEGEKRKLALKVLIPIDNLALQKQGNEMTGGFTVYISTGDGKGSASDVSTQTHQIRWPAEAMAQAKGRSMTFNVDVVFETGRSQVSVAVVDQGSERVGYAVTKL